MKIIFFITVKIWEYVPFEQKKRLPSILSQSLVLFFTQTFFLSIRKINGYKVNYHFFKIENWIFYYSQKLKRRASRAKENFLLKFSRDLVKPIKLFTAKFKIRFVSTFLVSPVKLWKSALCSYRMLHFNWKSINE